MAEFCTTSDGYTDSSGVMYRCGPQSPAGSIGWFEQLQQLIALYGPTIALLAFLATTNAFILQTAQLFAGTLVPGFVFWPASPFASALAWSAAAGAGLALWQIAPFGLRADNCIWPAPDRRKCATGVIVRTSDSAGALRLAFAPWSVEQPSFFMTVRPNHVPVIIEETLYIVCLPPHCEPVLQCIIRNGWVCGARIGGTIGAVAGVVIGSVVGVVAGAVAAGVCIASGIFGPVCAFVAALVAAATAYISTMIFAAIGGQIGGAIGEAVGDSDADDVAVGLEPGTIVTASGNWRRHWDRGNNCLFFTDKLALSGSWEGEFPPRIADLDVLNDGCLDVPIGDPDEFE